MSETKPTYFSSTSIFKSQFIITEGKNMNTQTQTAQKQPVLGEKLLGRTC
jgi:hypothetical protein